MPKSSTKYLADSFPLCKDYRCFNFQLHNLYESGDLQKAISPYLPICKNSSNNNRLNEIN